MIWQKWRKKKSIRKKKRMEDLVREAAIECPSKNELCFEGELDETVALGFFGPRFLAPVRREFEKCFHVFSYLMR